jgi:glycerol-3-phosphate acyltransferase PlsY
MYSVLISVAIGYLLGSIPSGFLVGKCRGIDIRQHGSGNIGATNVVRTLGRPWGVLVFALDVLKGIVAVQLAMRGLACSASACPITADQLGILAGLGCFLGHCFPVWLKFKGGKGVATGAGILIGLTPWTAIIGVVIWGIVYYSSRYVSLASIIAATSLPIIVWVLQRQTNSVFWFTLVISALAIWRHRTNIQRLLAGTESRFEKKK